MAQYIRQPWVIILIVAALILGGIVFFNFYLREAGAQTWSSQTSGTGQNLNDVYFVNSNTGWAVGDSGTIRKTTNGGSTWTGQTSGTGNALYDVYFVNSNTGWAAGASGTIRKTTNGGSTWTGQTSGTGNAIKSIYFVNANTGWFLEDNGTIRKTTNGGSTWTVQSSDNSQNMERFFFLDSQTAWAVGGNGTIRKTTNGGSSWANQSSGTSNSLRDVFFVDASVGWAVGDSGTIRKTTNGGSTWTGQTSGTGNALYNVYFSDSNTGWVIGGSGTILKTTDGGTTWTAESSGVSVNLNGTYFIKDTEGWLVGGSGAILKLNVAIPLTVTLTANPDSGDAPLNDVDLTATVSGAASNAAILYDFDCTSDGTYDVSITRQPPGATPYTAADACDYPEAGIYIAKVQAKIGVGGSNETIVTATVPISIFSFSLSSDGNKTLGAGGSITNQVTATLSGGTTKSVSFSASGIPGGTTASFSSTSCNPTCTTTLTLATSGSTPTGNHTITITGVGGTITKTTTFTLEVLAPSSTNATTTISAAAGGSITLPVLATNESTIKLTIPANAVTSTASVVAGIQKLSATSTVWVDPPANSTYMTGIFDVTITTNGTEITTFASPITLSFTWIDEQLSSGFDESTAQLGFFDANNTWQLVSDASIDTVNNVATANVTHLTRFALVASAGEIISPPPPAAAAPPPAGPRSGFFVWELREGELVTLKPGCEGVADLNFDNRINLIDFSVLAFWFRRGGAPTHLDINRDGVVDVADFSILIYCWTR